MGEALGFMGLDNHRDTLVEQLGRFAKNRQMTGRKPGRRSPFGTGAVARWRIVRYTLSEAPPAEDIPS